MIPSRYETSRLFTVDLLCVCAGAASALFTERKENQSVSESRGLTDLRAETHILKGFIVLLFFIRWKSEKDCQWWCCLNLSFRQDVTTQSEPRHSRRNGKWSSRTTLESNTQTSLAQEPRMLLVFVCEPVCVCIIVSRQDNGLSYLTFLGVVLMKKETVARCWRNSCRQSESQTFFLQSAIFSKLAPHHFLFMFVTSDNGLFPQRTVCVYMCVCACVC